MHDTSVRFPTLGERIPHLAARVFCSLVRVRRTYPPVHVLAAAALPRPSTSPRRFPPPYHPAAFSRCTHNLSRLFPALSPRFASPRRQTYRRITHGPRASDANKASKPSTKFRGSRDIQFLECVSPRARTVARDINDF